MLLPKLHHLLLAGSVCWLHTSVITGDIPQGARRIGYSARGADRALKSRKTPGTTPITPDGPLTHLDWADGNHVLGKFDVGSRVMLGDPAGYSKADAE